MSQIALLRQLGAGVATAIAVKLLDDFLDETCFGDERGRALAVYSPLLLGIASALHAATAAPLFFGAYVAGMAAKPAADGRKLWLVRFECAIVLAVSALLFGIAPALSAVLFAVGIQLIDDVMDRGVDLASGRHNLALEYGVVEVAMMGAGIVAFSFALSPDLAVPGSVGAGAVFLLERLWKRFGSN